MTHDTYDMCHVTCVMCHHTIPDIFQGRRPHSASVPPPPPPGQPPSLAEARAKERLPESSEVVIDPRGHVPRPVCRHVSHVPGLARGARPSYAASARQVLMSSTRGLMRLRAPSLSSLYINDVFQDGQPCQAVGCPLNPKTRVSWPAQ